MFNAEAKAETEAEGRFAVVVQLPWGVLHAPHAGAKALALRPAAAELAEVKAEAKAKAEMMMNGDAQPPQTPSGIGLSGVPPSRGTSRGTSRGVAAATRAPKTPIEVAVAARRSARESLLAFYQAEEPNKVRAER